ncbi:AAA family ATPase [Pseudomonas koreensis]|uniref:AAA family ATPase n=1 Tax=Pseudomonas koreensis TaxID=198620 RepID=UPI003D95ECAD
MKSELTILLISGPLAVGKTSVRENLTAQHGYVAIQSSSYLKELAAMKEIALERANLQMLGDWLDMESQFSWVVSRVALPQIHAVPEQTLWVFDAVRKPEQVVLFRNQFGESIRHVHFTCSEPILKQRYQSRARVDDAVSYEDAINHPNELSSRSLDRIADRVVNLEEHSAEAAAKLLADWLTG